MSFLSPFEIPLVCMVRFVSCVVCSYTHRPGLSSFALELLYISRFASDPAQAPIVPYANAQVHLLLSTIV